ncbi:MAG: ABC transporter permease [Oscillospiraceae bacterium]|nr:ABC transporter permease [Oscillospiraceae bacterium]
MRLLRQIRLSLDKYRFLIRQLVSRDFKVKYKRSALGVLWSLLYPVLTMSVMAVVFSHVFRAEIPGVSYPVYLLTGITFFNYFSEATNLSMSSILANFSLLNKVYVPKYVFPLTKCLFVGINFLLTLLPLYAVILLTGTGLNWAHLLLPYAFVCLFAFTLGMSFLLAAAAVFVRDMLYIYGVALTLWMYLTPLFWDLSMLGDPLYERLLRLNPLCQYISFARQIIFTGRAPGALSFAACALSAGLTLWLGAAVFRRKQDEFVYYM